MDRWLSRLRHRVRLSRFTNRKIHSAAPHAVHGVRVAWVQGLPAAERILDLGGASTSHAAGALVQMGYPHGFSELIIVDLPQDNRDTQFSERRPGW